MSRRLGDVEAATGSPEQQELYRRFTTGERVAHGTDFTLVDDRGRLLGPPATWQLSPRLGLALEQLGRAVRYSMSLPRRVQEIVILSVARAEDDDFERWAHVRAAAAAGLSEAEITALLQGTPLRLESRVEQAAQSLAQRLLTGASLDDAEFDDAVADLGHPAVFEIVTLVGYYRMIALQLRAFDIRPPS